MSTAEPLVRPPSVPAPGADPAGEDVLAPAGEDVLAPAGVDVLAPAVARLSARYGQVVAEETIRRVVGECHERLRTEATVTTYLLVLAERAASRRIAALARDDQDAISSGS